jgi:MFS family permease
VISTAPHPFTIHNYRAFWFARLTVMLALYCMMLIIAWQAYNIARETMSVEASAFRLGLLGLIQFIPRFFLTPAAGWVADNMSRRNVGILSTALQAGIAAALAILTATDSQSLMALYAVSFALGVVRTFMAPALSALAPNLVPIASLPTAIALSSIAWQAGMLVGPAMAGPLYLVDHALHYWVSAGLYTATAVLLMTISHVARPKQQKTVRPMRQIQEGWQFVWQSKLIFGTISLDLFAVLLAGATALIPVYARDILQVGEEGLSILAAAPAVGAGAIAILFSFRPINTNVGNKMLGSVFIFGLATIIFGLSTSFILSIGCLIIVGGADMFSVYVRQSLIQLHTPYAMRGRVSAVSLLTISASNELGEAESGFLAGLVGPVIAVVAGGAGAILVTAAWARLFPEIGAARTFDPPKNLQID